MSRKKNLCQNVVDKIVVMNLGIYALREDKDKRSFWFKNISELIIFIKIL